jgi:hypothetical protein
LNAPKPRGLVSSAVLGFREKMEQVVYSSQMANCEKARNLKVILGQATAVDTAKDYFPS